MGFLSCGDLKSYDYRDEKRKKSIAHISLPLIDKPLDKLLYITFYVSGLFSMSLDKSSALEKKLQLHAFISTLAKERYLKSPKDQRLTADISALIDRTIQVIKKKMMLVLNLIICEFLETNISSLLLRDVFFHLAGKNFLVFALFTPFPFYGLMLF